MMQVLMALALGGQEADFELRAKSGRESGGYELTITGRGGALVEESSVGLRFQRMVRRADWKTGAIEAGPGEDAWGRCAYVEQKAFRHLERFEVPGEVRVTLTCDVPGGGVRERAETWRVGAGADLAARLRGDAREAAGALEEARALAEEAAELLADPCVRPRRAKSLANRLGRALGALREEAGANLHTATLPLVVSLLADLEKAAQGRAAGRGIGGQLSSLSGQPFDPERSLAELETIEGFFVRERALLIAREAGQLVRDIAAAADPARWRRAETGLLRAGQALSLAEREARSGPLGARYAEASRADGATVEELLRGTSAYLDLAAAMGVCPAAVAAELEGRRAALEDLERRLDEGLRAGP